jgi:hypothetical protein
MAITSRKEVDNIDILPVLREVSNVYSFVTDGLGKIYPSLPKWVLNSDNPRYLPNASPARKIHKLMAK